MRVIFLFLALAAPSASTDPIEAANDFAREYNIWAALIQAQSVGTLDARAVLAWHRCRQKFVRLDQVVRGFNSPSSQR